MFTFYRKFSHLLNNTQKIYTDTEPKSNITLSVKTHSKMLMFRWWALGWVVEWYWLE